MLVQMLRYYPPLGPDDMPILWREYNPERLQNYSSLAPSEALKKASGRVAIWCSRSRGLNTPLSMYSITRGHPPIILITCYAHLCNIVRLTSDGRMECIALGHAQTIGLQA